jgi:hypothetical protein
MENEIADRNYGQNSKKNYFLCDIEADAECNAN